MKVLMGIRFRRGLAYVLCMVIAGGGSVGLFSNNAQAAPPCPGSCSRCCCTTLGSDTAWCCPDRCENTSVLLIDGGVPAEGGGEEGSFGATTTKAEVYFTAPVTTTSKGVLLSPLPVEGAVKANEPVRPQAPAAAPKPFFRVR